MKKRITRIWGVGLIVALLVSLLVAPTPASADDNRWEMEVTPGGIGYAILASNVADFGVYGDGEVIWAVTGTDNYTYKSTNGGASWIRGNTTEFTFMPDLIAVTPDDADNVAVVNTNAGALALSLTTNGGAKWDSVTLPTTNVPATITDVDFAAAFLGVNNLVISGTEAGPIGNAWYFEVGGAAPSWQSVRGLAGFAACDGVDAVAFSPNFPSDLVLVALTDNSSGTEVVQLQIMSFSGAPPARMWNSNAGFPTQYPVTIVTGAAGFTGVASGSLALDPEYLGSDDVMRNVFIGLALTGDEANSGIYRTKDVDPKDLKKNVLIHSVAYNGTTLAAGTYTGAGGSVSTTVWRSSDPMSSIPTFFPTSSLKSPGGENMVRLHWGGTTLFSGTSGDESAFGASLTDGEAFNDLSLIDTTISNSQDVGVSADGTNVQWATDDGTDLSVWRTQGTGYQRVLSVQSKATFISRVAPDDPDVVYVAQKGSTSIYYTKDAGEEKWYTRTCGVSIQDLAAESADVVYALAANGAVSKSTNSGFTWGPPTATQLGNGYSILSVSDDVLFVGGTGGFVSYSTDGNRTWTDIKKPIEGGAANVVVAADANYANNNTIYTASDTAGLSIMKWVVGTNTSWDDIFNGVVTVGTLNAGVYGLVQHSGVLYALAYPGGTDNQSALYQCLEPLRASKTSPSWASEPTTTSSDPVDTTVQLGLGGASPNGLKASSGSIKLWAVKTNGTDRLYGYKDVLAVGGPSLIGPADEFSDSVNTITGLANQIVFSCNRLSNATAYQLQIAYDEIFTEFVAILSFSDDHPSAVLTVGPGKADDGNVTKILGSQNIDFALGNTYYWRMKSTEALNSPWSESRAFTIEPGVALVPTIGSPANGATITSTTPAFSWSPVSGATLYEFQLASDPSFALPIVSQQLAATGIQPSATLEAGKTYFWRVRAIAPLTGLWSTISNFSVAVPVVEKPPVVVQQVPPPVINIPPAPPAQEIVIPPAPTPPAPITPGYIWAIVIIGAVLVIAVIVLIVRTRRAV